MVLGLENRIVYHLLDVVEGNCTFRRLLFGTSSMGRT